MRSEGALFDDFWTHGIKFEGFNELQIREIILLLFYYIVGTAVEVCNRV